jgi:hypothetical protein
MVVNIEALDVVIKSFADLHQDHSKQVEYFADRVFVTFLPYCRAIGSPSPSSDVLLRSMSIHCLRKCPEFTQVYIALPCLSGPELLGPPLTVHTKRNI